MLDQLRGQRKGLSNSINKRRNGLAKSMKDICTRLELKYQKNKTKYNIADLETDIPIEVDPIRKAERDIEIDSIMDRLAVLFAEEAKECRRTTSAVEFL